MTWFIGAGRFSQFRTRVWVKLPAWTSRLSYTTALKQLFVEKQVMFDSSCVCLGGMLMTCSFRICLFVLGRVIYTAQLWQMLSQVALCINERVRVNVIAVNI